MSTKILALARVLLVGITFALAPSLSFAQTMAATTPTGSASFTVNGAKIATIAPGQTAQYVADFAGIPGGGVVPEYRLRRGSATTCGTIDGLFHPWESVSQPDSEGRLKYTRTDTAKQDQIGCSYDLRVASFVNSMSDTYDMVVVHVVSEAPAPVSFSASDAAPFGCYMGTKADTATNVVFVQMLRTGERDIQNGVIASFDCLFGDKAVKTRVGNAYTIPSRAYIAKKMKDAFGSSNLTTAGLVAQLRSLPNQTKEIFNEGTWKLTAQINAGSDGTQAAYFLATWTPPTGSVETTQFIQAQTGAVASTASDPHLAAAIADQSQRYREQGMTFSLDPEAERVPTAKPPLPEGAIPFVKVTTTYDTTAQ